MAHQMFRIEKILNIHIILRPVGQAVKTSPFHGGDMGSIPVGVTKNATLAQLARAPHL